MISQGLINTSHAFLIFEALNASMKLARFHRTSFPSRNETTVLAIAVAFSTNRLPRTQIDSPTICSH